MRIKILSFLLVAVLSVSAAGVSLSPALKSSSGVQSGSSVGSGLTQESGTQLKILKSDDTLTQEQTASRIKAEYLIENNGYKDSDEVVVMISLEGDSLIDKFNAGGTGANSVAAYAQSFSGTVLRSQIEREQNSLIASLYAKKLITGVEYTYSTVANAIAVNTTYGNLEKLEKTSGVYSCALSETYNRVQTVEDSVSYNPVEIDEATGIYKAGEVIGIDGEKKTYTGKGTVVAVLDSGFDMSHSVFNIDGYDSRNEGSLVITKNTLLKTDSDGKSLLSSMNASATTAGLTVSDVWYSNKIPYSYDYADKDSDVFPYDSEHGTHVAGIIAGQDDVISGIAPDAQLVLMKVFPDLDAGGRTEDIIAALEDAVKLNVDAINMSLGSSCGFTRECDDDKDKINVNNVYDAINESGISLITAASNSYSSSYGGEQGSTNFVTNPDSGTVGSPSTYKGALSVASISGTKSRYMIANMSDDKSEGQVLFYKESNSISGKENNFYEELLTSVGVDKTASYNHTFEYVVVPGVGVSITFEQVKDQLAGKIAVVRRGENSFEEKARLAKKYGAIACIIYNNIDGDILMSMGKTDHIPTISISKDDGEMLVGNAVDNVGTLTVSSDYLAGPFMSDFSSWGPTPSLEIKPEITAHGGNIYSSIPGSYTDENGEIQYRYDHLSGTSMATPNLCGIVVLIRQYIKDNYKNSLNLTDKDVKNLANQLMMSTADIVKNEENNPYSPRKQGAGLANFANTVKTKAYITVDGLDRSKIELGDDKNRSGVYTMTVNLVNLTKDSAVSYDCSLVAMTESVSTSDDKHVAETPYILGGSTEVKIVNGDSKTVVENGRVTVPAGGLVKVEVTYTLDKADRKYIDAHFENGMYVEGFLKFTAIGEGEVDLNAPFLAFYGDWTEAPMFDKTYYEVETTAHDAAIDDDDKVKADYYATTPYGSYYYNYMIPLGTYLYDTGSYDAIPATEEHAAISDTLGAIDGINTIGAGLLRGAKTMYYTITDKVTGEVVWSYVDYNATKSYAPSGSPMPYYDSLKIYSAEQGFINNRSYVFTMIGLLDYDLDSEDNPGGLYTNKNNTFSFEFTMDNEAPILKNAEYTREYDETEEKYRYYITLTVYDNHYAMSVNPVIFTSSSTYTFLTDVPIPLNGQKGQDCTVTFEITDYLEDIYNDSLIPNAICFSIDDYALNTNIYVCELPGTAGEFKFTKNGEDNGEELIILTAYENELIDLKQYLYTADETIGANRENEDYLSHLTWISSNEKVLEVEKGYVKTISAGRATVTVREMMEGLQAVVIINVKQGSRPDSSESSGITSLGSGGLEGLRFSQAETMYAHALAAQTSEIGQTGSMNFISAMNGVIKMYPGERVKLYYEVTPWQCASNYEFTYESTDPSVAEVDQDGNVRAKAEGYVTVTLEAKNKTTGEISYISATVGIEVKSPFVIESRVLVAYKGIGGEVVIPDDEGILYIGSYAFCLYTTDRDVILDDDDYDANKVPDGNSYVTSVVIPEGVEEIQKYAFYNCIKLEKVVLPTTLKYIREYSFYGDVKLTDIHTRILNGGQESISESGELGNDVLVIGAQAFANCKRLEKINLEKITSIGVRAFEYCASLKEVNLETLRNAGREAFKDCSSLTSVKVNEHTKLSYAMFARSGLESVDLYETKEIPDYCFAKCASLTTVKLNNSIVKIGTGAFSDCSALTSFSYADGVTVEQIGDQAFYNDTSLTAFTLPDCEVSLGAYSFYMCDALKTIKFGKNTVITSISGTVFEQTSLETFEVPADSIHYAAPAVGDTYLVTKEGGEITFVAKLGEQTTLIINEDSPYNSIGASAFAGSGLTAVIINKSGFVIGDYAFANCEKLEEITLPEDGCVIGDFAFAYAGRSIEYDKTTGSDKTVYTNLVVGNLDKVTESKSGLGIGDYAFAGSAITEVRLGEGVSVGEGAFYQSRVTEVTLAKNVKLGLGAFQNALALETVVLPELSDGEKGGIVLGDGCFANDVLLKGTLDFTNQTDEIPLQAFYGCRSLIGVTLVGVKTVGNAAFAECSSLSNVYFAEYDEAGNEISDTAVTERIGDYAFGKLTTSGSSPSFQTIKLPSSLKGIGDGAFMYCLGLTEIEIPQGVTFEIGAVLDSADESKVMHFSGSSIFFGCSNLKKAVLPESVTRVGDYMFGSCLSLADINLGGVKEIGDYALAQAVSTDTERMLKKVDLTSVESIGEAAFANNEALSCDIYAPALKTIAAYAFKDTAISSFNAPALISIGESAFDCTALGGNNNLKEFAIPSTLECVGKAAFAGCNALERFVYTESGKTTDTATINDYAKIEGGVLYNVMPSGSLQLNSVPANLKNASGQTVNELEVLEGTVRIEYYAGNANKNIVKIILPESLKLIGNYAFYGYSGLLKEDTQDRGWGVYFRSYAAPAMESAYDYTASVTLNKNNEYAYSQLHAYLDLFQTELCYYNFVDLVGKNAPITMYLPDTVDKQTEGYDSVVYKAYFGKYVRTDKTYLAMSGNMSDFVSYAKQIIAITATRELDLGDEALVTNAVSAFAAIKETDAQKFFGTAFTASEWIAYRNATLTAKESIRKLKVEQSSDKIKALDQELLALPDNFDLSVIETLRDLTARIDELKGSQRTLLNLDKYDALVMAFGEYMNSVNGAIIEIENAILGD